MHSAAAAGNKEAVSLLLKTGAPAAIQDQNGMWPAEAAAVLGHPDVAALLDEHMQAELTAPRAFLEAAGYEVEGSVSDTAGLIVAIKMFQSGQGLAPTGMLDAETLAALLGRMRSGKPLTYSYALRFVTDGGPQYQTGRSDAADANTLREAVIATCPKEASKCKFNFAPPGTCIAVAAPEQGEYRASRPRIGKPAADEDASAVCSAYGTGCRVLETICSAPESQQ
jgi:hypothetical protein